MKTQAGIIGISALLFSLLLQGCGSTGAADGQGSSTGTTVSTSSGNDAAPTLTFTGFAVVQVKGALSGMVVAAFSEDMDPSSLNSQTFKIVGPDSKPVPGSVMYIGVTAVFTPSVRFEAESNYTGTLTTGIRSLSGVALAKDHSWTFKTPSPSQLTGVLTSISSTKPKADQVDVALNSGVNVSFHQLMDPSTINASTISLVDADGTVIRGKVHYSGLTASFVPDSSLEANTTYKARVAANASSLSGVPMDADKVWTFTTGTDPGLNPPQVVYAAPLIGDTGVSLSAVVVVQFSEAMDATSISTGSFTLLDNNGVTVDGTVTYTGDTAIFTPDAHLLAHTLYTATINTNATSAGGMAMQQGYSWTFTTGGFNARMAPEVVFSSPAPGEVSVPTSSNISIAFSQVMDPTTLTPATVQVTDANGNPVIGSVSYLGNIASFTPASMLTPGTSYTVTLSSSIKSLDGVSLTGYSWSFRTQMPM